MPKLVYLANGFGGVAPQLWADDSILGVMGNKEHPVIQQHDITDKEAELGLSVLMKLYPFEGG